jgi:hypothetical protein
MVAKSAQAYSGSAASAGIIIYKITSSLLSCMHGHHADKGSEAAGIVNTAVPRLYSANDVYWG